MTDPGLNQRLRQRSRRSGVIIGVSMLLTLVVCVASFTMIYARLEPVVADFVGRGSIAAPTSIPTQEPVAQAPEPTAVPTEAAVDEDEDEEQEEEATSEDEADEPAAGGDNQAGAAEEDEEEPDNPDEFRPDYQIDAGGPVNLRPGPGVDSGAAVIALPQATPLMFLNEEQPTQDPQRDLMESGQVWMRFQTEDGIEGWIRELDVSEYEP